MAQDPQRGFFWIVLPETGQGAEYLASFASRAEFSLGGYHTHVRSFPPKIRNDAITGCKTGQSVPARQPPINCLCGRIAALHGARNLDYPFDMSRFLRSVLRKQQCDLLELSVLKGQCLDRRIPDMAIMQSELAAWQKDRNNCSKTISWQFTTNDARVKLKRLYPNV